MEDVLFGYAPLGGTRTTTARFANVAFSKGSLLQAFLHRLSKGEPLAVPDGTWRYFVSLEEAGELCLLASVLGEDGTITIPDLDPKTKLVELQTVAEKLLRQLGFEPRVTHDEHEARELARARVGKTYPLLLTPLDTGGEKPYEEFVARGETVRDWMPGLRLIQHLPTASVEPMLQALAQIAAEGGGEAELAGRLAAVFRQAVRHFSHRASARNLDQRQ
jgi:FlaA1/EpsC-like NDP-sugar epimerase